MSGSYSGGGGFLNFGAGVVSGIVPIENGGTNSGTALTNQRFMVSVGDQIIEGARAKYDTTLNNVTFGNLTYTLLIPALHNTVIDQNFYFGNATYQFQSFPLRGPQDIHFRSAGLFATPAGIPGADYVLGGFDVSGMLDDDTSWSTPQAGVLALSTEAFTASAQGTKVEINVVTGGTTTKLKAVQFSDIGEVLPTTIHNNGGNSNSQQAISSGTYTPTLTNVTNIASSTAQKAVWSRVGNVVTVSGAVTIEPTAASTTTAIEFSLPISSNFANANDCSGVGNIRGTVFGASGGIAAQAANDVARLTFISDAGPTSGDWRYTYQYEII